MSNANKQFPEGHKLADLGFIAIPVKHFIGEIPEQRIHIERDVMFYPSEFSRGIPIPKDHPVWIAAQEVGYYGLYKLVMVATNRGFRLQRVRPESAIAQCYNEQKDPQDPIVRKDPVGPRLIAAHRQGCFSAALVWDEIPYWADYTCAIEE